MPEGRNGNSVLLAQCLLPVLRTIPTRLTGRQSSGGSRSLQSAKIGQRLLNMFKKDHLPIIVHPQPTTIRHWLIVTYPQMPCIKIGQLEARMGRF